MAVHLFFSNQLDLLAAKYAEILEASFQHTRDPFQAPLTLVPNTNLGKWLQLDLARRQGICLNSDITYLENGLWRLLVELSGADPPPLRRDGACLQMLVLRALEEISPDNRDTALLWDYLSGGQQPPAGGQTERLWQLSQKLAQLFNEYEFHREEMIQAWLGGPLVADSLERAQQVVYRRLVELQAQTPDGDGAPVLSLNAFARQVFQSSVREPLDEDKPWVHCFGLSQISAFHIGLLARLAPYYEIFIHALNPSREFWEDTLTPGEQRWIARRQVARLRLSTEELEEGELAHNEFHPLLALWGKPGREHIRLLCGLTDYDFHACHGEAWNDESGARGTVLKSIQHSVFSLIHDTPAGERCPQDRSLQVAACPGIFREVATVYHSILHNLERNPDLDLTDIAVLVPDMTRYKPVVDYIFNQSPRSLVFNLVDSRATTDSLYAQGVLGLLELARGRFSRREVFQILLNPCVMARHDYTADDVAVWVHWAEQLNIFHTFDRAGKARRGYHDSARYTWTQGLQRMRLARVMASPAQTGDPQAHFQGLSPFSDLNSSDDEMLARFSVLVELLHGAVAVLDEPPVSGKAWRERLIGVLDAILAVPEDHPGEAGVRRKLLEALGTLALYDIPSEAQGAEGPRAKTAETSRSEAKPLSWDLVAQFLRSTLEGIPGGVGEYLTSGVTISALLPMRPIPLKIVYVLGMEEGRFPGRESQFALDLRRRQRRIGDINVPERNCYLFLELLMAVRGKFYISYVAKDLVKDREMQPCAVVHQLLRFVEDHILTQGSSFLQTEVPLKGESPAYLDANAVSAWSDIMVNFRAADRLACYRSHGVERDLLSPGNPGTVEGVPGGPLQWPQTPMAPLAIPQFPPEKLTLGQIKRFLYDPGEAQVGWHLGLAEGELGIELRAIASDEPFFSEFPHDYRLQMAALEQWLEVSLAAQVAHQGPGPILDDVIPEIHGHMQRLGDLPEGSFADLDARQLRDGILKRRDAILPLLPEMARASQFFRRICLGDGDDFGSEGRDTTLEVGRFPPVPLTLDPNGPGDKGSVLLHGELPWAWRSEDDSWHTLVLTGRDRLPGQYPDKHVLGPVIFALAALSGPSPRPFDSPLDFYVHGVYGKGLSSWRYRLTTERAKTYLADMIRALGQGEMVEWLPFETVTGKAKKPFFEALKFGEDLMTAEDFRMKLGESLEDAELSDLLWLAAPEVPPAALDLAFDRLGIFFEVKQHVF